MSEVKELLTKRGEQMVFLRLDDVTGGIDCVVFATAYASARELCVPDRIIIVKGRVDHKEGETKLLAQEISAFESVQAKRTVRLRIDATRATAGTVGDLATLLRGFPVRARCSSTASPRRARFCSASARSSASSRTPTSTRRSERCSASRHSAEPSC